MQVLHIIQISGRRSSLPDRLIAISLARSIPVLYTTGYPLPDKAPGKRILQKPFSIDTLISAIQLQMKRNA